MLGLAVDTVKCYCYRQHITGRKLLGASGPWLVPKSAVERYKRERRALGRRKKCQQHGGSASTRTTKRV